MMLAMLEFSCSSCLDITTKREQESTGGVGYESQVAYIKLIQSSLLRSRKRCTMVIDAERAPDENQQFDSPGSHHVVDDIIK